MNTTLQNYFLNNIYQNDNDDKLDEIQIFVQFPMMNLKMEMKN